jgi:16S rRNA (adenine1518-N6/adenine1519-N6)-dimethyltransferase
MSFSSLASPSATIAVLQRHGLATRKRLGQHFLIDDNVVGRILELAARTGEERVLEVGPGIGTLTCALAARARSVVAIERDEALAPALREIEQAWPNVRVVYADAVQVAAEMLADGSGSLPDVMVANLPYSVAATVVLRFFSEVDSLECATVMVQAEVADRMAAAPGTKSYGAYTVKLHLHAMPAGRFAVPRACFLPPPRVDSAVVRLDRVRAWSADDVAIGCAAAEAAFSQRRKTVRNAIAGRLGAPPDAVVEALVAEGLDPLARAETFPPEAFVRMGRALRLHGLLP